MRNQDPDFAPHCVTITLEPLGRSLLVGAGARLHDVLFAQGVEFPCGGRARCKGCRVRVADGELPVTDEDRRLLSIEELKRGWRLACQGRASADLTLELAQWEPAVLVDHSRIDFTPRDGLGIAIDLGTTTLVAQLLDLSTGRVLAVRTALNSQAQHGADIMSRIEFGLQGDGRELLRDLIRTQIGGLIGELLAEIRNGPEHDRAASSGRLPLTLVTIVGNTVMHHLFCGLNIEPLSRHPFESAQHEPYFFRGEELGWERAPDVSVHVLPNLGGFVGSDILAGILATGMNEGESLRLLIDLGTNGEIVVGNRTRLLCASTAAGPAFEGARISCGMRAAGGAISEVTVDRGELRCRVIGQGTAHGLCGSGLVDAVACAIELGWLRSDGRLVEGGPLPLAPGVLLLQADIRELQLAKAAIAAGVRILLDEWGANAEEVDCVWLAGAFGNYVNRASARQIGLIDFPAEKVIPAGNTALLGAKLALFHGGADWRALEVIRSLTRHVALHEHPDFMEDYIGEMRFPARTGP